MPNLDDLPIESIELPTDLQTLQIKVPELQDPKNPTKKTLKKGVQTSIAQYMYKNIHLLGFENNARVLNVAIRELMDNSLDAANQCHMLPQVKIKLEPCEKKGYKLTFMDFGPGITPEEVPNVCCRLLYGNKFRDIIAQRGQQGLGLTALILYSQKTRGKPVRIVSKTDSFNQTQYLLQINIKNNTPHVLKKAKIGNTPKSIYPEGTTGFLVELELESIYTRKGPKSTVSLLEQYCYLNPNLNLSFEGPDTSINVDRVSEELTPVGDGVKLVPHHANLGDFQQLFKLNPIDSIGSIIERNIEGPTQLKQRVLQWAKIPYRLIGKAMSFHKLERLIEGFKLLYVDQKPLDSALVQLGPKIRQAVTKNQTVRFDTILTVASPPRYFQKGALKIEACAFYGSEDLPKDQKIVLYRAANGSPLLYQAGVCCITRSVIDFDWKKVGLTHLEGELPRGNLILFIHVSSTKVPYVTQSKDAIADIAQIRQSITYCLEKLSKLVRSYMKKEDFYKTLLEKKKIINQVLPDLLTTLEKGLNRQVNPYVDQKIVKSKILQMVCFFREDDSTLRCINGSKKKRLFEVKTKEGWTTVNIMPLEEIILKEVIVLKNNSLDIEGLTPVDYLLVQ